MHLLNPTNLTRYSIDYNLAGGMSGEIGENHYISNMIY